MVGAAQVIARAGELADAVRTVPDRSFAGRAQALDSARASGISVPGVSLGLISNPGRDVVHPCRPDDLLAGGAVGLHHLELGSAQATGYG